MIIFIEDRNQNSQFQIDSPIMYCYGIFEVRNLQFDNVIFFLSIFKKKIIKLLYEKI
ncbi:unnamed protein product [Paramecium primaurelia]|uniref:Uncharacterized protein n=1 Tax=Paramecium primaurelia TaxID=5886 RepID=A0A8S1NXS8_PARPR|nr:unnamed protein product [Paramecium primaurelia]